MLHLDTFFGLNLAVKYIDDSLNDFFLTVPTIPEFIHRKPHTFRPIPHWRCIRVLDSLDKVTEVSHFTYLFEEFLVFINLEEVIKLFDIIHFEQFNQVHLHNGPIALIIYFINTLH